MVAKYRLRLYMITLAVLVGFGALVQRLWNLSVVHNDEYKNKIRGTKTLRARVPGARGEIKDRNGIPLVSNKPSFEVRINLKTLVDEYRRQVAEDNKKIGEENRRIDLAVKAGADPALKQSKKDKRETPKVDYQFRDGKGFRSVKEEIDIVTIVNEAVIEPLNQIGLAAPFNAEKLRTQYRTNRGVVPWVYRRDLTFEEFSQFAEHRLGLPGVAVDVRPVRQYLYDAMACHVLGYVNQADEKLVSDEEKKQWNFFVPDDYGVYGVEKSFNEELRGRPGYKELLQDEKGHIVSVLHNEEPKRGHDVWLTLDARIQYIAERALRDSIPQIGRGSVVVIQPATGEVLAMASVPSYNPNKFIPSISLAEFQEYNTNIANPLFNRAVKPYAPGSTYKVAISFAGIIAGTENEHFNCPGGITYGNKYMKCWIAEKGGSHGTLNLSDGLKNSCNCFFYQYGNRAGINNIEKAGHMFGFGERTGIELSDEDSGILPTPKWLRLHTKETWPDGNNAYTANTSIGQGYVLATPLQMACVSAAVGNGGVCYKPHLLKKVADDNEIVREQQPIIRGNFSDYGLTQKKLELVRRGMWKVVNEDGGTARAARIPGVEVAGKTGTAQAWRPDGQKDNHTLFIAFAPYVNPKYAVCILVQGGKSGGGCCAPVAKRVLEQALSLDQGGTLQLASVPEVRGHLNHIEQISFEGVAMNVARNEDDNDLGSNGDEPPKPAAHTPSANVTRAVPVAPSIKPEADAEGTRAVKNKQPPPRRASFFHNLFHRD